MDDFDLHIQSDEQAYYDWAEMQELYQTIEYTDLYPEVELEFLEGNVEDTPF